MTRSKGKKKVATESSQNQTETIRHQYQVIKSDINKLKKDLEKGYEMAKEILDKKNISNYFGRNK
jgi:hypothetical protein